jgi:hypothetical protein
MAGSTVTEYLAALPTDRRTAISAVRKAINRNLPAGYKEGIQYGMIGWFVPLSTYPAGYGGNAKAPLPFLCLAAQKAYMAVHIGVCFYSQPALAQWFTAEYKKSGKKLDMGKGCLRFKALDDLAIDVVERLVARVPVAEHVSSYQAMRDAMGKGKTKSTTRSTPTTKNAPAATRRKK